MRGAGAFAHRDGAIELDPKVRLSAEVGLTLGFVKKWDLYGMLKIIDRGDLREPTTPRRFGPRALRAARGEGRQPRLVG